MWTETYSLICIKILITTVSIKYFFTSQMLYIIFRGLILNVKTEIFWVLVLCHWVNSSWCCEGSQGFHRQVQEPVTVSDPAKIGTLHIQIWNVTATPSYSLHFIKKNPVRCNSASKFYYSIFIWSSTCFGWQAAHHQEPKTALAAFGFSYVEGCWTASINYQQPSTYEKPEAASAVLGSWWWAACHLKHVELHINME